jgi:P27 family predicted phage terminase small subunit
MGQRGPAPKSKKELAKRGSWRAKDRADDLEMPNKAPTAPTALSREAKAEWKRLVALLEPRGVLSEGDRIGLTVLCELWAEDRELGKLLGKLPTGTNDWKRVFTARQDVRKQLKDWCARFGLTPADRTRVKVDTGKDGNGKKGNDGFEVFTPKLTG